MTSRSFVELGVPADLATELDRLGIAEPFPIQIATIPDALDGRDLCGRAPTGSGKTLAFSVPTLVRASRAQPKRPTALVLTPTRELAAQIRDTMLPLARIRRRWVGTVYGGTSVGRDIKMLAKGIDVLVACPGRLTDLIQQGACDLSDVSIVVLDEADRMADMGFLPEVRRLLDQTRSDRQTLLFSATLDGDVDVLIRNYQVNPVKHVMEDPVEEAGDVTHLFWSATRENRRDQTVKVLRKTTPAIVFTRTKRGADRLARQLSKAGVTTAAIHGDRNQNQRERALKQFTDGQVSTLVATDVAARGIHVDDVAVVVHYDLAGSDKDYVHRSGRTGRAGATGLVVSMVFDDQVKDAAAIQRAIDVPTGLTRMDLADVRANGRSSGRAVTVESGRDRTEVTDRVAQQRQDRPRGGARSRDRRGARSNGGGQQGRQGNRNRGGSNGRGNQQRRKAS